MAASMETLSSSLLQRSSLLPSSSDVLLRGDQNKLCIRRPLFPAKQRNCRMRQTGRTPVTATIVERSVIAALEKPVRFKVRAAVMVRRKVKEGLKEKIANLVHPYQTQSTVDMLQRSQTLSLLCGSAADRIC